MLLHHLYQRCPGRGLPPTCLRTFAVALFFFFFQAEDGIRDVDRKSTRLNSSHGYSSYAVFCLKTEAQTSELQSRLHLVCRLALEKKTHQSHTAPDPTSSMPSSRRHMRSRWTQHWP